MFWIRVPDGAPKNMLNRNDPEYTKYLVEKWSKCELLDSGSIDIKTCILLESVPYQILEDGTTIPVKD